jgi:hypothetical protein
MCIENILLAMAAAGLFGCTYTHCDASGLKAFWGFPADFEIAAVIPFGYPKAEPLSSETEDWGCRLHIDSW